MFVNLYMDGVAFSCLMDPQSLTREDAGNLRSCALCSKNLDPAKVVALCDDCLKIADCCVGLERVSETE
jgi:hypothetical protein